MLFLLNSELSLRFCEEKDVLMEGSGLLGLWAWTCVHQALDFEAPKPETLHVSLRPKILNPQTQRPPKPEIQQHSQVKKSPVYP